MCICTERLLVSPIGCAPFNLSLGTGGYLCLERCFPACGLVSSPAAFGQGLLPVAASTLAPSAVAACVSQATALY